MKLQTITMALCLGLSVLPAHAKDNADELVYIGTHGSGRPGQDQGAASPQGIYAARFDSKTGQLTPLGIQVELERATWLETHPTLPVIYTVADSGGGMQTESNIHSFAIDKTSGTLQQINKVGAGGLDATHMVFDATSKSLLIANHGSGDVTALPIQADGSLGTVASSQKTNGTGPHRRQKMPQPHGVAIDPTHRYVLTADFGADRIFVNNFDGATRTLTPAQTPFETVPPGSGPRHLIFHPNGKFLYLNTELTAELRTYRWDAKQGNLSLVNALPLYPADYAGKEEKSSSETAFSRDGKYLYVSLRGDQDSIVVFTVNNKSGALKEIQRVSSQGKMPWSFGIDPTGRWMLVTNEASNSVTVLSVDKTTGKLSATNESLSVPKPVTVAFYPN